MDLKNNLKKKLMLPVNMYGIELKNIGKDFILTAGPAISEKENFNAFLASKYGWNKKYNGFIADLENKFAKYIGVNMP